MVRPPLKSCATILVIGHDSVLLQARRLVLGAFFDVESAGRLSEVPHILATRAIDLIVLCDTITQNERRQIEEMVSGQREPRPSLLTLPGPGNGFQTIRPSHNSGDKLGPAVDGLGVLRECAAMLGYDLPFKIKTANQGSRRLDRDSDLKAS